MSDLIKRLRNREAFVAQGPAYLMRTATEAADALEATNARIADLESKLTAKNELVTLLRASLAKVEGEVEGLKVSVQNWREFAEHQTWCATCAESVDSCSEGRDLRMAALTGQKER
ncbi:hypothetical protein PQR71_42390 [Paraburkholderia fungorum]|uniref:hypothetical protein n=1 Tax=Paraburkholderia fungorum TaxID=134537 RepID=UPI0038BD7282